jgi:hypothetical protein
MKNYLSQTAGKGFCIFLFAISFSCLFSATTVSAQKCKPDYSKMDKIEKKQIDLWTCELYETSFGGSLMKTSTVSIKYNIGRVDTINFVEIQLIKIEESDVNQLLESSLKGAKGNEFFFGIKDGEPLKFVALEATNKTQRLALSGKLATIVTLTGEIKSGDLQIAKESLTEKTIEAVRVKLENGVMINQDVKGKNGDKAQDKSVCFFKFLQEAGHMK